MAPTRIAAFDISFSHLHAGMIRHLLHVHVAGMVARRWRLRTEALHIERYRDLAGLLEFERDRHLVTLLQRALQIEHHQMKSTGRQLDGLAGLNSEPLVQ